MKSIKIYAFGIITLLSVVLVISCTKDFDSKTVLQKDFSNSTLAQVYVATVNASRNYVFVDGNPVTGALLSSGSLFPSSGYAFNVNSGVRNFVVLDTLTATTQVPLSFAENMQVSRNHTIFLYDTISTPKQKTVTTDIVIPSDNSARLRFANFPYSPVDIPMIDIYSARLKANIFSNLSVTDVTNFLVVPSNITDTFYVRLSGTTVNLQNFVPPTPPATVGSFSEIRSIATFTAKRSYTLVFRGGFRATATTNSTVRTLSLFANY